LLLKRLVDKDFMMRYRRLGKTGFDVSVIAFGAWAIGGADWGKVDDRDSIKAIHRSLDLGVNLFDTAPLYGNGHAESVLGKALEGVSQKVIIATKCGPIEVRPGLLRFDLSREGLISQVDDSLRRLKVDRIDLLQVHWYEAGWPIDETMGYLAEFVKAGKVAAIGVSNFLPAELNKAADTGVAASLQPPYNLFRRDIEEEILPICIARDLGVLVYEPLARGLLTDKFTPDHQFDPKDIRATDPRFKMPTFERYIAATNRVAKIAKSFGVAAGQIAIAWVLAKKGVTTALCGAKTALQAVENIKAADIELDSEILARLEQAASL